MFHESITLKLASHHIVESLGKYTFFGLSICGSQFRAFNYTWEALVEDLGLKGKL
jgi:hypothetical protein